MRTVLYNAIGNRMTEILRDRDSDIYEYLSPIAVQKLLDEHVSGRQDNHKILFSLLVCEEWLRAQAEPVAVLN